MNSDEIKMLMRGKEIDFVMYCGIPADVAMNRKHQKCACGGKRDRLRIENNGTHHCNLNGSGDYWDLIDHYLGITFKQGLSLASKFLGLDDITEDQRLKIRERAKKLAKQRHALAKIKQENAINNSHLKWDAETLYIIATESDETKLPTHETALEICNITNRINAKYQKYLSPIYKLQKDLEEA